MEDIKFYKYTGEPNKINKDLGEPVTFTGAIIERFDITAPVVRIKDNRATGFNYAVIESLNRNYFVDNVTVNGDFCIIRLSVDVLTTYKDSISRATATLSESENTLPFANNRTNRDDSRPKFKKLSLESENHFKDDGVIVMVTLKGNK